MKILKILLIQMSFQTIVLYGVQAQLIQNQFDDISSKQIQGSIGFIIPNEDLFYLFNSALQSPQKGNALISVGTFRFFHDASVGYFDYAISLDHSQEVTQFNQGILNILKDSSNRRQFIAKLFGAESFYSIISGFEAGLISREEFQKVAEKQIFAHQSENFKNKTNIQKYFPAEVAPEELRAFSQVILDFLLDSKKSQNTFLGTDIYFSRLKKLADSERILLVTGSLTKGPALQLIADLLNKNSVKVSVLNISNVHSRLYISPDEILSYLKNISLLPFSSDSQILVTQSNPRPIGNSDSLWSYHAVPMAKYLSLSVDKNQNILDSETNRKFYDLFNSEEYILKSLVYSCESIFLDISL